MGGAAASEGGTGTGGNGGGNMQVVKEGVRTDGYCIARTQLSRSGAGESIERALSPSPLFFFLRFTSNQKCAHLFAILFSPYSLAKRTAAQVEVRLFFLAENDAGARCYRCEDRA